MTTYPDVIVDLSHWQTGPGGGPIDFAAMKAGGIAAVLLKATQGSTWVDAQFCRRAMAAQAAGLLIGAYHFADASSAITQANHFINVAGYLPRLALDIEPNGIGNTATVAQAAEIVARIQMATGNLPLVYIGRYGPAGDGVGLPNAVLARCELWLPAYNDKPITPAGWDDWLLWQYASDEYCPGVQGTCDRNYFNGSAEDIDAWWSGTSK